MGVLTDLTMLRIESGMEVDMGECLLELDETLDIPQDIFYKPDYQVDDNSIADAQGCTMVAMQNELLDSLLGPPAPRQMDNSVRGGMKRGHECSTEGSRKTGRSAKTRTFKMGRQGTVDMDKREVPSKAKHVCDECGKTFKRAHNLKIHGRLHSGDKPYGCPFAACGKEFRWKSSIVSHINWHRTKRGDVLPGEGGTSMHNLILKGKCSANDNIADTRSTTHKDVACIQKPTRHAGGSSGDSICDFVERLTHVSYEFEGNAARPAREDMSVPTASTTASYDASAVTMELEELEELRLFGADNGAWETNSEGRGSGLSGMLLPSLSCCKMDETDGLGSFLDDAA